MNKGDTVDTVDVLREARDLIATKGWTQGTFARDADGRQVGPFDESAVCFCPLGAMRRAGAYDEWFAAGVVFLDVIGSVPAVAPVPAVADWNDLPARTKDDVLAAFDRAITQAS